MNLLTVSKFTVVIPVLNEQESLKSLAEQIRNELGQLNLLYEIIFVDDGSTDHSWEVITSLVEVYPKHIHALRFRRNRGKAQALAAGFQRASGDVIITMDADLQDDPKEMPGLIKKLFEGYDLVVGWKKQRQDSYVKRLSSRIFNRAANFFSGLALHDQNCGFKCFRKEILDELPLYGDMHRMMPSMAAAQGFSITELPVKHHPRHFGQSKYGFGRAFHSAIDLFTIWFLRHFHDRPGHLLVFFAMLLMMTSLIALGLGLLQQSLILLVLGSGTLTTGILLFCIGLLVELWIYYYHRDQQGQSFVTESLNKAKNNPIQQATHSKVRDKTCKLNMHN